MSIIDLWQPVLGSAAICFIAGSVIWMAMPWHKSDFTKLPDEEGVRNALSGLAPGQYNVPHCTDMKEFENPEMQQKFKDGPVGYITIAQSGLPAMGSNMGKMFGYNLLVAVVCAYMVGRTGAAAAGDYMETFRVAGTVAFIAYGMGYVQESIWFARPWSTTVKTFFDALIYGLLTGGVFGWLA